MACLASQQTPTLDTPDILPLMPLILSLDAWLALPSLSCWLIRMIHFGYTILHVPTQIQWSTFHLTYKQERSSPSAGECCPRWRRGFTALTCTKERSWVETNLRSASFEPGPRAPSLIGTLHHVVTLTFSWGNGYVVSVPSTPFRSQVGEPALSLLCPVHALY